MATKTGQRDFQNKQGIINLAPATQNGQPLTYEQFGRITVPAPSHLIPLSGFPRVAYYDVADGIIKESRSDNSNKLCEMVVLGGTVTTLDICGAMKAPAHGYVLGQALFVASTGGLTTNSSGISYLQRIAMAPHADYLIIYNDLPKDISISRLSAQIKDSPFVSKKVSILGDSITEFATGWPYLKEFLGAGTITNHGIAGSTLTWNPINTNGTIPMQSPSRINAISPNDEVIIVWGGANDFYTNIPVGVISDVNTDTSNSSNTFYGAINRTIDLLRNNSPFARIVFITPTQRNYSYTESLTNTAGFTIKQYVDAVINACAQRGVSVVNVYEHFGMQRSFNLPYYTYDGLHLDLRGYTKLQWFLANALIYGAGGGIINTLPPSPPFFDRCFNVAHIPNRDVIHVHSNSGIVYLGIIDRSALFFVSSITTIEWTQDANTSSWIGVGGIPTNYTGVSLKDELIGDFTPPSYSNVVFIGASRLVSQPALAAMTRFRAIKDGTGITTYGWDGTAFVQTHSKFIKTNYPFLTGWANNFDFSTQHSGQSASNYNTDGVWWQMKDTKINNVPLYQALQYGGV
jgi:hypothetical protein